ncbi:UDP-4-amino-4-deoxy-L-arabinose--oxoglutarate aminotransferase [Candidatus Gugararchaeum adminiculabundum]|nr:UDP-4-amino-4-deoxy-L-arabinose--oxoglutarate aminotransferase [Candidatus Gugararchaeum adminiculabundum]
MTEAAMQALQNDRFILGENVAKFETEFAKYCGTEYAVAVGSGTAALQLTLLAAGVKGKVLTTPNSFIATSNAVIQAGMAPLFADVERKSGSMDCAEVKKKIGRDTSVLLPVHIYGTPFDLEGMAELAEKNGKILIEDACQAHGARYKGKRVGSFGLAGCFSFYTTKNMTIGGDGGMVVTSDKKIAEGVKKLRDCGRVSKYVHDVIGFTSRMNSVNAAVGREQLRSLDSWNGNRVSLAKEYRKELGGVGDLEFPKSENSVFHLLVATTKRRDELIKYLTGKEIEAGIHYPIPIHLQPIYRSMFGYREGMFPNAEEWSRTVISLPMFPTMSREELAQVCGAIREFFKSG